MNWLAELQDSAFLCGGTEQFGCLGDPRVPNTLSNLFQKYKMLRLRQPGFNPYLPVRTNLDISAEIVRAVKGDALIHGPNMAARPVGSDWRTRRPSQVIPTYC